MVRDVNKPDELNRLARTGLVVTKLIIGANIAKFAYLTLRDDHGIIKYYSGTGILSILLLTVVACALYMVFTAIVENGYRSIINLSSGHEKEQRFWILIYIIGLIVGTII